MYRISDLIEYRQLYSLGNGPGLRRDEWLSHVLAESSEDELAFITIRSTLTDERVIKAIKEKYHIIGAYKLGNIFTNATVSFYIVHLSKVASGLLKVALFSGRCYDSHQLGQRSDELTIPDSYTEDWISYSALLENWMNGGKRPDDTAFCEFHLIPEDLLINDIYFPDIYSKESTQLRKLLSKHETHPLSSYADILSPRKVATETTEAKVLKVKDFSYPLDFSGIDVEEPTNVLLKTGDIIIPRISTKRSAYLFDYSGKEPVYASSNLLVIRCRNILPEYLYFYLCSDIAIKVLNAIGVGEVVQRIPTSSLVDLPVPAPKYDSQRYKKEFFLLTNKDIRVYNYEQVKHLTAYAKLFSESHVAETAEDTEVKTVEDILNIELGKTIKAFREDQLRDFLDKDVKELNACFKAKAYKATLILAGSILEAVLIDWLSEIHRKNYFEEDYYVIGRDGTRKKADLINYIDEIKYIRRPRWYDEADKAHFIRQKRNLVHAKLCMQSDEINEDVCREVISYLEDVLRTRGVNSNR